VVLWWCGCCSTTVYWVHWWRSFFDPRYECCPAWSRGLAIARRPSLPFSLLFFNRLGESVGTFCFVLDWMLLFCCFAWAFCGCKYVFLSEQNCLTPVALTERCCQHVCSRQTNPHETICYEAEDTVRQSPATLAPRRQK
jgi:hypothetical protein